MAEPTTEAPIELGVSPSQDVFDASSAFETVAMDAPTPPAATPEAQAAPAPAPDSVEAELAELGLTPAAAAPAGAAVTLEQVMAELADLKAKDAARSAPVYAPELQALRSRTERAEAELLQLRAESTARAAQSEEAVQEAKLNRMREARRNAIEQNDIGTHLDLTEAIERELLVQAQERAERKIRGGSPTPQQGAPAPQNQQSVEQVIVAARVSAWREAMGVTDAALFDQVCDMDDKLRVSPKFAKLPEVTRWNKALELTRAVRGDSRPKPRASAVLGGGTSEPTNNPEVSLSEVESMAADAMGISRAEYLRHKVRSSSAVKR